MVKISALWRIGLSSKDWKKLLTLLKVCFLNFKRGRDLVVKTVDTSVLDITNVCYRSNNIH